LKQLISNAGGRFHFITVQGRHLFKETTFTVSTLPGAWLEPPPKSECIPFAVCGDRSRSSESTFQPCGSRTIKITCLRTSYFVFTRSPIDILLLSISGTCFCPGYE